ncbi:MAG: preprotein translocase subunit SecG [Zavarzinia sp.]|nr:preprotein translocase subunit SecG [Zavarzinia sp.]
MDYLLVLHLIIAVVLIGVVLIQKSEGGALGIGGGGGGGLMTARGAANFLTRLTAILAGLFMLTSLGLTMLAGTGGTGSIVDQIEQQQAPVIVPSDTPAPAPEAAAPAPTAPAPTDTAPADSAPAPAVTPETAPPASAN